AVARRAMTRSAVDGVTLLAAREQLLRHGQRDRFHKIGRAGNPARVQRVILERINFLVRQHRRLAARHSAFDRQTRAELVGEQAVVRLRTELGLAVHVREQFDRRAARLAAPEPGDAHDQQAEKQGANQEVAHYSSTTSMCLLPADSSSLRVSASEYFGSPVSITTKNRSWVARANRPCFNSG